MYWQDLVLDFAALAQAVVAASSLNKVAGSLNHHKKTVAEWSRGTAPKNAQDVAWLLRKALHDGIDVSRFQKFTPIYDFSPTFRYEEKSKKDPPTLEWLTEIQPPPAVPTRVLGMDLDTPLGVASSPLLSDDRWTKLMLDLSFGLSTFKTRRRDEKRSWQPPQIAFVAEHPDLRNYNPDSPPQVVVTFDRSEVNDTIPNLVNSIGVPSESAASWQEIYERVKRLPRGRFVGVSIMPDGDSRSNLIKDLKEVAQRARELNPPFVELNISCPNLEKRGDIWNNLPVLKQICLEARQILGNGNIPLVIKLPYTTSATMRGVVRTIGTMVEAIAFKNTLKVRPVVKNRDGQLHNAFTGREFGGLSGPSTFEMGLKGLRELLNLKAEFGYEFEVIAIGGISTTADIIECLNLGAQAVQVCTAAMFDPLLAWNLRFQMKPHSLSLTQTEAAALLWPRNQSEIESLRNAYEASSEIQRRQPQRQLPWETFASIWNNWMLQQPTAGVGRAHRLPAPRSISQWTQEFLNETSK
jgi:dihydroorotate dehydrogenase (NAD+) catalytic subunit